jgi:2-polyprenyl-3-methyl-5-hydroxy-6-metoxy-1,4-benzoquinol methylase
MAIFLKIFARERVNSRKNGSMSETDASQDDPSGLETLQIFSETGAFNRWMFEEIEPFCGGVILEIGSGIGNISTYLLERFDEVVLSDLRPEYLKRLSRSFGGHPALKEVCQLDLATRDLISMRPELAGRFDTVVALNVVEHIKDHETAIANCKQLLRPGGQLVVLVPAYAWLYNVMDEELGHFRRYQEKELVALLEGEGFEVTHTQFFNMAAIFGWWLTGSLFRIRLLKRGPVRLFNRFAWLARLVDQGVGKRVGLSAIAVARKIGFPG